MFIFIHLLTKSHFANYDIRDTTTDERQTSGLTSWCVEYEEDC